MLQKRIWAVAGNTIPVAHGFSIYYQMNRKKELLYNVNTDTKQQDQVYIEPRSDHSLPVSVTN